MLKKIKSIAFYYGMPLLAYAIILLLIITVSKVFSISFDLTTLIIALMIATSWFLGSNPGLLIAIVFEASIIYFQTTPYTTKSAIITFNRMALFVSLVIFTSSRRTAEQKLRTQHEILSVTLSSIGDAVISTTLDGKVNFINPTAEKLTGWSSSEAFGKSIEEVFKIINEETRQTVESPFTAVVREGIIVGLANHTILIAKNGKEVPIEDSGAPIKDGDGNVIGVIIVFHDVSERRQIEKEREILFKEEQNARKEAETLGRLKDEFLATVSHELRTPLNSILGWSSILNKSNLEDEKFLNACNIIERNAKTQAKIIDDILDVSHIITGKLQLNAELLQLAPIIRATIETLQPAAMAKSINIKLLLDEDAGQIFGDAARLQQIIWNLVSNAIKFTTQEGEIELKLSRLDSQVELKISDNGIGINNQFLPFVFERFRQMDSSITRIHGGLGLGLSIVKYLVELHGGTAFAESKGEGKGALFTVRLPLAIVEKEIELSAIQGNNSLHQPESDKIIKEDPQLQGLKILVIDDDLDTLEMLKFALESFGAAVKTADSASTAFQTFQKGNFDIIVSDLGMPQEDGYSLLGKIRAKFKENGKFVPAIAVSGYARNEDFDRAIAAGFQLHISKPVDPQELALKILEVLQNHRT